MNKANSSVYSRKIEIDLLRFRLKGEVLPEKRFELGTAHADAYFAGYEHGVYVWRDMQENPESYRDHYTKKGDEERVITPESI
jgi:hypothetical protein